MGVVPKKRKYERTFKKSGGYVEFLHKGIMRYRRPHSAPFKGSQHTKSFFEISFTFIYSSSYVEKPILCYCSFVKFFPVVQVLQMQGICFNENV